MKTLVLAVSLAISFVAAGPANTATVDIFRSLGGLNAPDGVNNVTPASLQGTILIREDFSNVTLGNNGEVITSVGTFETLGGRGTGESAINGGTQVQVRDGNVGGRFNVLTNPEGLNNPSQEFGPTTFLDSNDTWGIAWIFGNFEGNLRQLSGFVTDPSDANGELRASLFLDGNETALGNILRGQPNATAWQFEINFRELGLATNFETGRLEFGMFDRRNRPLTNDGFALSNLGVSVVPLPTAAWFLLSGIGAMFSLRLFRKAV